MQEHGTEENKAGTTIPQECEALPKEDYAAVIDEHNYPNLHDLTQFTAQALQQVAWCCK